MSKAILFSPTKQKCEDTGRYASPGDSSVACRIPARKRWETAVKINISATVPVEIAVGGTRTPNLQVRSLLLYPIELRPRVPPDSEREGFEPSIRLYIV